MSMGRGKKGRAQGQLFVATAIAEAPGHPFYQRLNAILEEEGFDRFSEELCSKFYAENGRPSIAPGVYFRMLLIGYFEGLESERGISWRVADSLTLRSFLGYDLDQSTPEHSSLSRIRQRLDLDTHESVFAWVLRVIAERGLLRGKTIGVDTTTLEANAALRSIVRRDTGESYRDYLTELAKASGIETPTRQDLARIDKKRPGKGSNEDWEHPHDPESKITKMKDGRTHLAHKAVHAVDMETGALTNVRLVDATQGDAQLLAETVVTTQDILEKALPEVEPKKLQSEMVGDKGFHSNAVLTMLADDEVRSYVSEPGRGRRRWDGKEEAREAVYGNRRRIRGERGKRLQAKRGELLERTNAHLYETGAMRRLRLRGRANILKRLLVHAAAFNLSLILRTLFGAGTPRGLAALADTLYRAFLHALYVIVGSRSPLHRVGAHCRARPRQTVAILSLSGYTPFSTGC